MRYSFGDICPFISYLLYPYMIQDQNFRGPSTVSMHGLSLYSLKCSSGEKLFYNTRFPLAHGYNQWSLQMGEISIQT